MQEKDNNLDKCPGCGKTKDECKCKWIECPACGNMCWENKEGYAYCDNCDWTNDKSELYDELGAIQRAARIAEKQVTKEAQASVEKINQRRQGNQYIRKTEYFLYNYKSIRAGIENKLSQYSLLKESMIMSCQGTYERIEEVAKLGTSVFGSGTSNPVLSLIDRLNSSKGLEKLREEIQEDVNTVECVDRAVKAMPELEQNIIKLRYFEGKQWKEIGNAINLTDRQCRTWKNRALTKIAIGLYGTKIINLERD